MLFSNSKSTVTAELSCANNPAGRQLCLRKSNGCAVLRSSSCFKINSDFFNTIRTLSGPVSTKKSGFGPWSGKSDLIGGTGWVARVNKTSGRVCYHGREWVARKSQQD